MNNHKRIQTFPPENSQPTLQTKITQNPLEENKKQKNQTKNQGIFFFFFFRICKVVNLVGLSGSYLCHSHITHTAPTFSDRIASLTPPVPGPRCLKRRRFFFFLLPASVSGHQLHNFVPHFFLQF